MCCSRAAASVQRRVRGEGGGGELGALLARLRWGAACSARRDAACCVAATPWVVCAQQHVATAARDPTSCPAAAQSGACPSCVAPLTCAPACRAAPRTRTRPQPLQRGGRRRRLGRASPNLSTCKRWSGIAAPPARPREGATGPWSSEQVGAAAVWRRLRVRLAVPAGARPAIAPCISLHISGSHCKICDCCQTGR